MCPFLHAGMSPFPAVIDLFGGTGGLKEFKASLLASRGFLTLSLAFMAYKDLPDTPEHLVSVEVLDYFKVINSLGDVKKLGPH